MSAHAATSSCSAASGRSAGKRFITEMSAHMGGGPSAWKHAEYILILTASELLIRAVTESRMRAEVPMCVRHACSRRLLKLPMSVSSLVGDAIANRASPSATGRRQRGRRAVGAVARSEQLSRAAGGEASSERKVRAKMRRRQSPCEPRYTQEDTRSVGRRTGRGDSITCRRCGPSRENSMAQA